MITIYNAKGTKIIDVTNLEGSYCDRSIMGGSTLQVVVRSDKAISFQLGSYVNYRGHRYTLMYPELVKKQHTKSLEYTLLLHGEEELLAQCLVKDTSAVPYRVKFALTAKPIDFVRFIVDSLNKHYGGGWSVGEVIDTSEQTLAFNHEYCLGALSRVAETFNTEYGIEGKKVSLGKVSIMADNPLPMSYGSGNGFRSGTGRHNDGKKLAIGKLYVEGGTRNIDYSSYGAQTLLLPKSATLEYNGRTYRTDPDGMYVTCEEAVGSAEGSYDGSSVYPSRVGTVTEVIEAKDGYDFTDKSIPETLNYNDYRIKGEKAIVVFQTGALTGREFALEQTKDKLTGYIHSERKFRLVSEEQDGFVMPGGNFVPKPGDKYAVFNITLPAEYLSDASRKLFDEAVRYFDSVINPPYLFSGEVDPIWAKKEWLRVGGYMQPGAHILFSDPQYHPEGSVIRVTGVRTPLDHPYAPQLTLSSAPSTGQSVSNALSKLEAEPVLAEQKYRRTVLSLSRSYSQIEETQNLVETAYKEMGGRLKAATLQAMQMVVGSREGQFGFVLSKADPHPLQVYPLSYDKVGAKLTVAASTLRHLTLGQNTAGKQDLTSGGDPSRYRYWTVAGYTSPALEPATPYYVYLKASKTAETASVELSETPLKETATDYLLLAGILNSEDSGSRSYVPLHGFTEITPGQMRTDRVVSADGSVVFDLAGNTLHIGTPDGKSYLDYNTLGDGKVRIKGGLMTVGDADTTIEEALQEQEDKRQALDRDRPAVWAIEIYDTAAPLAPAVFDDKLAGYRTQATYAFRILRSGIDVTEWARSLSPPPWAWRRRNPTEVDDDGLSDTDWENAHAHDLTVTLSLRDIAYRCDLSIEADSDTLETLYKSKN